MNGGGQERGMRSGTLPAPVFTNIINLYIFLIYYLVVCRFRSSM